MLPDGQSFAVLLSSVEKIVTGSLRAFEELDTSGRVFPSMLLHHTVDTSLASLQITVPQLHYASYTLWQRRVCACVVAAKQSTSITKLLFTQEGKGIWIQCCHLKIAPPVVQKFFGFLPLICIYLWLSYTQKEDFVHSALDITTILSPILR